MRAFRNDCSDILILLITHDEYNDSGIQIFWALQFMRIKKTSLTLQVQK